MHSIAHVGRAGAQMDETETEAAGMGGRVRFLQRRLCKHGSACERSTRAVAYDSSYEDDQDGWSVVGGDGCCD